MIGRKPETALTRAIKAAVGEPGKGLIPGLVLARVHSGIVKVKGGWMHLSKKGTADFLGMLDGRALAVEAKTDAYEQSDEQRVFAQAWMDAGGLYWIVRSVEELLQRVHEEVGSPHRRAPSDKSRSTHEGGSDARGSGGGVRGVRGPRGMEELRGAADAEVGRAAGEDSERMEVRGGSGEREPAAVDGAGGVASDRLREAEGERWREAVLPVRVALWDAINEYAEACGGDTSAATVSDRRMRAVVAVERLAAPARGGEGDDASTAGVEVERLALAGLAEYRVRPERAKLAAKAIAQVVAAPAPPSAVEPARGGDAFSAWEHGKGTEVVDVAPPSAAAREEPARCEHDGSLLRGNGVGGVECTGCGREWADIYSWKEETTATGRAGGGA